VIKNVRAYNVKVGDQLFWFDTKKMEQIIMVVDRVDSDHPDIVQYHLKQDGKGPAKYTWQSKRHSLVRVRREDNK
jgi:hypothetical protein